LTGVCKRDILVSVGGRTHPTERERSLMLVTFGKNEEEVERVCRAEGCKNRFLVLYTGRGGRVKEYCSEACKKQGSRKGKAENALVKSIQLQKEHDEKMEQARHLMEQAEDLMKQADLAIFVMGVAQRENVFDRLMEDLNSGK
jgi:DNA-binding transcriptional regulator LsrR (DeoR family)